jgi:hypothetical protein
MGRGKWRGDRQPALLVREECKRFPRLATKDDDLLENLRKPAAIAGITVDIAALVSPRRDVVDRFRKLEAKLAGHQSAGANRPRTSVEPRCNLGDATDTGRKLIF